MSVYGGTYVYILSTPYVPTLNKVLIAATQFRFTLFFFAPGGWTWRGLVVERPFYIVISFLLPSFGGTERGKWREKTRGNILTAGNNVGADTSMIIMSIGSL